MKNPEFNMNIDTPHKANSEEGLNEEYLNDFDNESEVILDVDDLEKLKETNPELHDRIIEKMINVQEQKVSDTLNDPEYVEQLKIEEKKNAEKELKAAIDKLYEKNGSEDYTDI